MIKGQLLNFIGEDINSNQQLTFFLERNNVINEFLIEGNFRDII